MSGNSDLGRNSSSHTPVGNEAGSSDEEEDDDDDTTTPTTTTAINIKATNSDAKTPVPLVDYILNVVSIDRGLFLVLYLCSC